MTRKTIAGLEAALAQAQDAHKAEVVALGEDLKRAEAGEERATRRADAASQRCDELRTMAHDYELRAEGLLARLNLLNEQARKADGNEMVTVPRRVLDAQRYEGAGIDSTFNRSGVKPWWK